MRLRPLLVLLLAACSMNAPYSYERASYSPPAPALDQGQDRERYAHREDNDFLAVNTNPLSTFSIDVDTASYSNVRRYLENGRRPPKDAVRIEELVNYFPYDDPAPRDAPFAANVEVAPAPWKPEHLVARIGIKGRTIEKRDRPPANLVFLVDVSGSMGDRNKLPLLKESLKLLVEQLEEKDRIAIAVYAGASGLALPSTSAGRKGEIFEAIDELESGGSTNGAEGIELAYQVASANFRAGGVNRVLLATDGDFNVGVSHDGGLVRLVQEKAKSGVFLTVLGFGMGNLNDSMLEQIADKGNGQYAYIDSEAEARKALVEQLSGTLVTIAKDVKIQVEFNPAQVASYRLIGYENRLLKAEDFNDDRKDAGEIGAGHSVTALYELVPTGVEQALPGVDPLRYQQTRAWTSNAEKDELMTVRIRFKEPEGDTSRLLSFAVPVSSVTNSPGTELRFASAVAAFGMILRDSPHKGGASLTEVRALAAAGLGRDAHGYREGFLELVKQADQLGVQ